MQRAFPARQRGVSLFIVLVILLLSLIIVLGGLAVSNLNESLVGNQSDAQRAYSAAQALINVAEIDIRLNNARYCMPNTTGGYGQTGKNSTIMAGTPAAPATCTIRYPYGLSPSTPGANDGYLGLQAYIGFQKCGTTAKNSLGVCFSSSPTDPNFMTTAVNTSGVEQLSNGATYNNTYIPAAVLTARWGASASAGGTANNLALGGATTNFTGGYWVEVFPYSVGTVALGNTGANVPTPDGTYPFVFRITALARGLRGNTVSVLRTYYVPYPKN